MLLMEFSDNAELNNIKEFIFQVGAMFGKLGEATDNPAERVEKLKKFMWNLFADYVKECSLDDYPWNGSPAPSNIESLIKELGQRDRRSVRK